MNELKKVIKEKVKELALSKKNSKRLQQRLIKSLEILITKELNKKESKKMFIALELKVPQENEKGKLSLAKIGMAGEEEKILAIASFCNRLAFHGNMINLEDVRNISLVLGNILSNEKYNNIELREMIEQIYCELKGFDKNGDISDCDCRYDHPSYLCACK